MSVKAITSLILSQRIWWKGSEFADKSIELYMSSGEESDVFTFAGFEDATAKSQQEAMNDFMAWDFSRKDGLVRVLPVYSEFEEGHYFLEGYFDRVSEIIIHDFVSTAKEFWANEQDWVTED